MNFVESFVEGIAQDFALDKATEKVNNYAEKHVKTKDPFKGPDGKKLKLRSNATEKEQKNWKWIQKRAWIDDKCFMGCYPVDCGIGLGPILVAVPCIGPLLMYAAHARLITMASLKFNLSNKLIAKMNANILFDLFLTFPPVIGSFFAWMNGCSTRNAAMIFNEIDKMLIDRENGNNPNLTNNESFELQEVETGKTFTNPFKTHKDDDSNYSFPTQQQYSNNQNKTNNKNNGLQNQNQNRNQNRNNQNYNPAVPPRDYKTPQRPNRIYQSNENQRDFV